jgi:murein DD-endopeptidase MepM/ murein hydrolase activator NlpD
MTERQTASRTPGQHAHRALRELRQRLEGVVSLDVEVPRRLLVGGAVAGSACFIALLGLAFAAGMQLGERSSRHVAGGPRDLPRLVAQQKAELDDLRARAQERVDALSARVGQVNAHVVRLDALGRRLAELADIDSREFDFDSAPSTGGPESEGVSSEVPDLTRMIDELEDRISLRDAQLGALEGAILQRDLREQTLPDGRPVRSGYISSHFGTRQDPFTGQRTFHKGVDYAGPRGSDVVAVGAGVVTFAGYHAGYGGVVEISHGDGYVTRYAHNQRVKVQTGQTVSRGDVVALLGSTGRATGPHVHFEVLRNGRPVNPLGYVDR